MRGRADDFEDDGFSFRQRRVAQLEQQMVAAAYRKSATFLFVRRCLIWIVGPPLAVFLVLAVYAAALASFEALF